jgi:hypothetical protein
VINCKGAKGVLGKMDEIEEIIYEEEIENPL